MAEANTLPVELEQSIESKRLAALDKLAASKLRSVRTSIGNDIRKLLVAGTGEYQKLDVEFPTEKEIKDSFAGDLEFLSKISSLVIQRKMDLNSKMNDLSIDILI